MKKFKGLVAMILMLLLLVPSISVNAAKTDQDSSGGGGLGGNGTGGSGSEGSQDMTGRDGASDVKTLFLIYTCDSSGHATSPIVARSTFGNEPISTSGAPIIQILTTRFGQKVTKKQFDGQMIAWGMPPFNAKGMGNGDAIKQWLLSPFGEFDSGAEYVCRNYLDYSYDEFLEWASKEDSYLCIESGMYAGAYRGSSHMGWVLAGATTDWARLVQQTNYLGRYTHGNLPNSLAFDQNWLGLAPPSDISSKHPSEVILSSQGYGIIAVKPVEGDRQLVKVYRTAGSVDRTTYSSCGESVALNNEGSYKLVEWQTSKKKTKATSTTADFPEVTSGSTKDQSGGASPTTVKLSKVEKAVFVLLERDKEPTINPEHRQDSLHAYELNYAYPIGGATDKQERLWHLGYEAKNYKLDKSKYEKASSDTISEWTIESDQCSEDLQYKVQETLGGTADGDSPLTHRYRTATGKFDPFTVRPKIYSVDDTIEPRYSYTIRRTLWEPELKLCSYVGQADCSTTDSAVISKVVSSGDPYMTGILQFAFEDTGATTSATMANGTEKELSDTKDTDHLFTAKAYSHWKERSKSEEEKENEDGTTTTETVYGEWEVKHEAISEEMIHYTITHYADKYRTNIIGCVSNPERGEVDSTNGSHSLSDFKVGFSRHVAMSQRSTSIKIYPEVQMMVWYETNLYNYETPVKEVAYVMGEYKREASPATLHGYFAGYTRGSGKGGISIKNTPEGTTILASAATGTIAEDAYSSSKKDGRYNGSTAMGTTFDTTVTNHPALVMFSAVLSVDDCADGHTRKWGNSPEDADASHQAYVANFSGVQTDLYMNIEGFSDSAYLMSYSISDTSTYDADTIEVPLEFYRGEIQKGKEDAIKALETISAGSEYTGDQLWDLWGVEDQIKEMFEDINDEDNHSGEFCQGQSDAEGRFGGKWYDEETSHLLLKFYRTEWVFGQIYADDKVDYNMLPQDARSRYLNRGGKLTATFHVRFWLGEARNLAGSLNVDTDVFEHNGELRCDEVKNTRFIIDNLTTAEMKK